MIINNITDYLEDIEKLEQYIRNLPSKEEKLQAIKYLNQLAKKHELPYKLRCSYINLELKLLNEQCFSNLIENQFDKIVAISNKDQHSLNTTIQLDSEIPEAIKEIHSLKKILKKLKDNN